MYYKYKLTLTLFGLEFLSWWRPSLGFLNWWILLDKMFTHMTEDKNIHFKVPEKIQW